LVSAAVLASIGVLAQCAPESGAPDDQDRGDDLVPKADDPNSDADAGDSNSDADAGDSNSDADAGDLQYLDSPVPETIEECEAQAMGVRAHLVFEPRRQMVEGESYDLQAALALGNLPPNVTFETPTTLVDIDARCQVEAELTGSEFEITPEGPQPQSFVGTRTLLWTWDVKPEHSGEDLELELRLQVMVSERGRSVPGRFILNRSVIDVNATPRTWWQQFGDAAGDMFGHPVVQVLAPAFGVGCVALWRRQKKRAPASERSPRISDHTS
jgi:hypothetical protein